MPTEVSRLGDGGTSLQVTLSRIEARQADSASDKEAKPGSQLAARGLPVLVSGTGFSTQIPGGIAVKVDQADEYRSLAQHLLHLIQGPEHGNDSNESGAWLRQVTNPDNVAADLLHLVVMATRIRPAARAIDRIGRILMGWRATGSTIGATGILDGLDLFDDALPARFSRHVGPIDRASAT